MSKKAPSIPDKGSLEQPVFENPQEILMNAPVGIFTTTPDGRYLSVNNTHALMHGYDSPRQLMDSITDIATQIYADPADRDKLKSMLEQYGEVTNFECLLRHRSGSTIWVSQNVSVLKDEDGNITGYQGFNQDITEKKRAEQSLRVSEERTRHLNAVLQAYNQVTEVFFNVKDVTSLLQDVCQALVSTRGYYNAWIILLDDELNVTYWGQAGLDDGFPKFLDGFQYGNKPACALNASSSPGLQVVIDPGTDCEDCPLAESYAGRASFSVRLEVEGFVLGLLTVSIPKDQAGDSEEQKLFTNLAGTIAQGIQRIRLEEIRRIQRVRLKNYEQIISRVNDPMSLVGTDYRYIIVNDAYLRVFGKSRDEIEGSTVEQLLGKDIFQNHVKHHLDKALAGEEVVYELDFYDREGSLRHALVNYYPFHDQGGQLTGVVASVKDITELKLAEEKLRDSEEKHRRLFETMA
ncbi:PAS domain S-box protein, partial [Desulfonatronospira sp.]|uniref:PAS domain S-box protein n=1 Tax=Desulfonatronospira sp. TaxID=1962951 RepID=UPI0025BC6A0D